MKKTYVTPEIEKVSFQYRDQVVVASNGSYRCTVEHSLQGADGECKDISNWISDHA